eukprot:429425-Rhodomonas_salina.3
MDSWPGCTPDWATAVIQMCRKGSGALVSCKPTCSASMQEGDPAIVQQKISRSGVLPLVMCKVETGNLCKTQALRNNGRNCRVRNSLPSPCTATNSTMMMYV